MLLSADYERSRILNSARNFRRSRLSLLLALLAVFGLTFAGTHQPVASASCPDAANVNYYSDATYSTVVGNCHHSCCQVWSCSGTLTQYSKIISEVVCDFT